MEMNERIRLTDGNSNVLNAWASMRIGSGSEDVGDYVEQNDTVVFTIHNTRRNRKFLYGSDAEAEATRSMPGRSRLNVVSVRPTPDRAYLLVECKG